MTHKRISQTLLLDAIALLLASGTLTLAIIDPSTRHAFGEVSKVLGTYVGQRYISASKQRRQQR